MAQNRDFHETIWQSTGSGASWLYQRGAYRMRKYLLAGAAALVIAAPAAATTDHAGYVGVDGGILFPKNQDIFGDVTFTDGDAVDIATEHVGRLRYKHGLDLDFVGGYDFGMFRLEGELGYKRA